MNSVLAKNAIECENEVMHNYQSGSLLVIYNDWAGIKLSNLIYHSVDFKYVLFVLFEGLLLMSLLSLKAFVIVVSS